MNRWFSASWEANWQPFQYFNLYRLCLALIFAVAVAVRGSWANYFHLSPTLSIFSLLASYVIFVVCGLLLSVHWQHRFNLQLSVQIVSDIAVVGTLTHLAGGVASGLAIVLLVSLTAASLVGQGRLVLFYAALATLMLLGGQLYGIWYEEFDYASIVQAGLMSAAFFATAVLGRLLGQRVMANEELARKRGVALHNQILISRRIVERMLDGLLIVTRDDRISRYNPMAARMLGLPEEVADDEGSEPKLMLPLPQTIADALLHWRQIGRGDGQLQGVDGRELRARFEATESSDGEVLILLEDVDRIKEQAQQLKLAALGRLTASIAHEIRNPLASIAYAGELLHEERRGELQDRLLRIIGDNVGRLDRIVRDVLDLGRQSRAQVDEIVLADFCREFITEFQDAQAVPAGVIVYDGEAGLRLSFDRAHLHQVLWNLVANAVRYSQREAGSVRLRARNASVAGQVELHVIDDGPGIQEKDRGQIFEPFFTTYHQGTGLGLYIARELCAINGGRLDLLQPPAGAEFVLTGRKDTCLTALSSDGHVAN